MAIFIDIHINVNLYDLFVWWLRNQELSLPCVRCVAVAFFQQSFKTCQY